MTPTLIYFTPSKSKTYEKDIFYVSVKERGKVPKTAIKLIDENLNKRHMKYKIM